MSEEQKTLFENQILIGNKIKDIGSFIQNDLDFMLSDGTITKEDIKKNLTEFVDHSSELMNELRMNLNAIYKLMKKYSK